MARRLAQERYLAFPISFDGGAPAVSDRSNHIREQILQTLFTEPRERIFRPNFGAGLQRLLFEPNTGSLAELTQDRLASALVDILAGEVDPKTLQVIVTSNEETLTVQVSYQIAAIAQREQHDFVIPRWGENG